MCYFCAKLLDTEGAWVQDKSNIIPLDFKIFHFSGDSFQKGTEDDTGKTKAECISFNLKIHFSCWAPSGPMGHRLSQAFVRFFLVSS
jgi:hypothetical protein